MHTAGRVMKHPNIQIPSSAHAVRRFKAGDEAETFALIERGFDKYVRLDCTPSAPSRSLSRH